MVKSGGRNLWLILAIGLVAGSIIGMFLLQNSPIVQKSPKTVKLVTSTQPSQITDGEDGGGGTIIRANSCDADSTCEVNNKILSPYGLTLSSNLNAVKVEGDLTITTISNSTNLTRYGTLLSTNQLGSFTITPASGAAKINADLTLSRAGYLGGVILKSNEVGSLVITPSSGSSKLESDLTLTKPGYLGGAILGSDYYGNLTVSSLRGYGNAYVCVDSNGKLFRSYSSCLA